MNPKPIAKILQTSLFFRMLFPAVVCLGLLTLYLGVQQKRSVERQNEEFAKTLAIFTQGYMDGVWHSLEHFAATASPQSLKDMLAVLPVMERLLLIDKNNTIVSVEPQGTRGLDFPIRFDSAAGRRLLLSRPLPSPQSGNMTVFIGVATDTGVTLAGELNLREMTNYVETLSTPWRGEVIICDAYGNVLSHPDAAMVATQANIGDSPLFRASKQGLGGLVFEEDGRFYLGAQAAVPGLGWKVLVRTRAITAFAPTLAPVAGVALVMSAVFIMLTILLRRELDRTIARPMAESAKNLECLPEGSGYCAHRKPAFAELNRFELAIEDMAGRILAGETQLRESERRFRAIFEQAAVGIMQLSLNGTFLRINDRFQDISGYSMEELRGKTFNILTLPEDLETDLTYARQMLAGELSNYAMDKRCRKKDGSLIWVRLTVSAVRDDAGEAVYFVGVAEDITLRKQAEQTVSDSLKEKEVLLREIHHRVKNNLQVISSLLYLQADRVSDQESLDLFVESRNRISSMALVHEELYRSDNLSRVNIREYLQKLVPRLVSTFCGGRSIGCTVDVQDVSLIIDQAIPFGLILNELVTNSAKHAFNGRGSGKIGVFVKRVDGNIQADVTDDGVGLPAGFDINGTQTLGMQLVVQLARQLRGELQVGTDTGTLFSLVFPLKEAKLS
ncbi:MAG: PAS domain S-box protein [Desulfovibrio sp.]|nr:PAS domain S-box protein [Desulfovibrio sp.]